MADQQSSSFFSDKVNLPFIVEKYLTDIEVAQMNGKEEEYKRLVEGLDGLLAQFKDEEYTKSIGKVPGIRLDSAGKATLSKEQNTLEITKHIYRILMSLLQRAGFMPIRSYEGELTIDLKEEEKYAENDDAVPEVQGAPGADEGNGAV